jgi:hypothetical protein
MVVQCLLYAAVGMQMARSCPVRLTYGQVLRLAVVAVTPCVLMSMLFMVIGVFIPWSGPLYLGLAMFYLWFGINTTCRKGQPQPAGYDASFQQEQSFRDPSDDSSDQQSGPY